MIDPEHPEVKFVQTRTSDLDIGGLTFDSREARREVATIDFLKKLRELGYSAVVTVEELECANLSE